jgi:deazaflavin-dependent oxidoreductase (nitroreductase family)
MSARNLVLSRMNRLFDWLYRTSGGKIMGSAQGVPTGVVTVAGRKTGEPRSTLVCCIKASELGENSNAYAVVGTSGGSQRAPVWALNLRAASTATVRIGKQDIPVSVRSIVGEDRDDWWQRICARYPTVFPKYATKTDRVFPIFLLEPSGAP